MNGPVKNTEPCTAVGLPNQIVYGRVLPYVAKLRRNFDGRGRNMDASPKTAVSSPDNE
jgi:hypothetical protein